VAQYNPVDVFLLPAGRDMDYRVAESVMSISLIRDSRGIYFRDYLDNPTSVPHYSTSIDPAWMVFDTLRKEPPYLEDGLLVAYENIKSNLPGNCGYICGHVIPHCKGGISIRTRERHDDGSYGIYKGGQIYNHSQTAPLAICRTALIWFEGAGRTAR